MQLSNFEDLIEYETFMNQAASYLANRSEFHWAAEKERYLKVGEGN